MSNQIDGTILGQFSGFAPDAETIIFAQKATQGVHPLLWIFLMAGLSVLAIVLLGIIGIVDHSILNGVDNLWSPFVFFVIWTLFICWSISRKRVGSVAITAKRTVLSFLPEFRSGSLIGIEVKGSEELIITWRANPATPFHSSSLGPALKVKSKDANALARNLSDLTQLPVAKSNGILSKTVYHPTRS